MWGCRGTTTLNLTMAPDGNEWSVSCPSHCTPRERGPDTHRIERWVPQSVWMLWESNKSVAIALNQSMIPGAHHQIIKRKTNHILSLSGLNTIYSLTWAGKISNSHNTTSTCLCRCCVVTVTDFTCPYFRHTTACHT